MSVSFAGRISYQSSYVVVPFDVSCAVPAWISEVLFTPSTPIHVAEYAPGAEGCTVGTTHCPLTAVNVGPVKMWPVQLCGFCRLGCARDMGAECASPLDGLGLLNSKRLRMLAVRRGLLGRCSCAMETLPAENEPAAASAKDRRTIRRNRRRRRGRSDVTPGSMETSELSKQTCSCRFELRSFADLMIPIRLKPPALRGWSHVRSCFVVFVSNLTFGGPPSRVVSLTPKKGTAEKTATNC
jgi:hypothetical protein